MAAFAKLFDLDGLGQVLATIETANDDDEADHLLRLRIEDAGSIEFRLSIDFHSKADARRALEAMDAVAAQELARPLFSARRHLAAQA